MQQGSDGLTQHVMALSEMQKELKEMQIALQQRLEGLELQQEELRQYQIQVIRALATFRALLEQEQNQKGYVERSEQ
jgi:16S rRNA G527 N7-methylase RsmG